MEAFQSVPSNEFSDDEFYSILDTISPFAVNEVEFCPKCKSAPCGCSAKSTNAVKIAMVSGNINKKR